MNESENHKLVIITAPSGSGKTTIVNFLLKDNPELAFSISACTRKAREGEVNGVNYYFIPLEEFTRKIANHEFAEFEMVYEGKYYGTLKSELNRIIENNQVPLVDIDVQGALRLKKHYGENALTLFIQAPSIEVLEQRLKSRGTETEQSLAERIDKAKEELKFANLFDYIIVNDDLQDACEASKDLIHEFLKDSSYF
ncbi:MAG TPA: guanylate kinase [Chitinophagaceae bacterium]|nr:guanylate kinase [Chitinophagaceae bacterium]